MKICSKCKVEKPFCDFHKRSDSRDGYRSQCKECKNSVNSKWQKTNPEKARMYNKKHWQENPEYHAERYRKWAKENPEYFQTPEYKEKRKVRESSESGKACRRAASKRYRETENGKARNYIRNANYRARRRLAEGSFTLEEWEALCKSYGNVCCHPGCEETNLTVDHIVPLSKDGTNDISNLQPLCRSHNSSKGAKEINYLKE